MDTITVKKINISKVQTPHLIDVAVKILLEWVNRGKHYKINKNNVVIYKSGTEEWCVKLQLATQNNIYYIKTVMKNGDKELSELYLGAIADSRRPRVGELHTRGNDLSDGEFTEVTWNKILADIVAYECIHYQSDDWKNKYK